MPSVLIREGRRYLKISSSAFGRWMQKEQKFEVSLCNLARLCLKKLKQTIMTKKKDTQREDHVKTREDADVM
jgi:hypothetical protein